MAISLQELFYGREAENAGFAHYPYSYSHGQLPPSHGSPRRPVITFDIMVPICCGKCMQDVVDALFQLESVNDAAIDPFDQRVTVTGDADPMLALTQVQRVRQGARLCTQVQEPYGTQFNNGESSSNPSNCRSIGDEYSRNLCGAYTDPTMTHYEIFAPNIQTRQEFVVLKPRRTRFVSY